MYKYFRMNYSGYFSSSFANLEKQELEKIPNLICAQTANDAEIIITSSDTITRAIPDNTKLVVHPNSGYDRFNLDWLKERNIPVIVGSPIRQVAVAEYYLSCIFDHFAPLPKKNTWDNKREWKRRLLKDQNILIFGFGHIGGYLDSALKNITKKVSIIDPFKNQIPDIKSYEDFDVIISAFGLNESTKNFFDHSFFSKCKNDVLFLHASRGGQLDVDSLVTFLKENSRSSSYVDVFPKEPYDLESIDLPNLHCSCHVAGVYEGIEENLIQFEKQVLLDYISLEQDTFLQKYKQQNLNERKDHSFLI